MAEKKTAALIYPGLCNFKISTALEIPPEIFKMRIEGRNSESG